jgi:hypothetical protein
MASGWVRAAISSTHRVTAEDAGGVLLVDIAEFITN